MTQSVSEQMNLDIVEPRHLRNRALTIRQTLPGWDDTAEMLERAANELERLRAMDGWREMREAAAKVAEGLVAERDQINRDGSISRVSRGATGAEIAKAIRALPCPPGAPSDNSEAVREALTWAREFCLEHKTLGSAHIIELIDKARAALGAP